MNKTLDYDDRLLDFIESLETGFSLFKDTADAEEQSIFVASLPGSRVVRTYYDGVKDKQLNHSISIKANESNRDQANEALQFIADELPSVIDIPSENGSYEFNYIEVNNEKYFSQAYQDGSVFFQIQILTILTIY